MKEQKSGTASDITERVLANRALRASEDRFSTAFHSSPIAMAITTMLEGRYIEVNEAFERQLGYGRSEILGRTSLELKFWPSPADRAAMIATLQRQKTVRDQNARFRTKSGSLITTLYSAGLITLEGQPCVLAAIADITAQKQAEDALRESESKYRLLAETVQSGIFIYRQDGAFCYVNPRVEAFTGYSSRELLSMSVWDLVHPDSRELCTDAFQSPLVRGGRSDTLRVQGLDQVRRDALGRFHGHADSVRGRAGDPGYGLRYHGRQASRTEGERARFTPAHPDRQQPVRHSGR